MGVAHTRTTRGTLKCKERLSRLTDQAIKGDTLALKYLLQVYDRQDLTDDEEVWIRTQCLDKIPTSILKGAKAHELLTTKL
jgi:hypothetical protein